MHCHAAVSVSFAAFLGPEIYGLVTDTNRTLSAAVWRLEAFRQGQAIPDWTSATSRSSPAS